MNNLAASAATSQNQPSGQMASGLDLAQAALGGFNGSQNPSAVQQLLLQQHLQRQRQGQGGPMPNGMSGIAPLSAPPPTAQPPSVAAAQV